MKELETKLYSSLRNAVRGGYNISRLAEYLQARLLEMGKQEKDVGHVLLVDTGGQTTISGSGPIFENFKETGQLQNFSGYGEIPKNFFEKGYKSAKLRYMKFNETYHRMPYNCTRSIIYCYKLSL